MWKNTRQQAIFIDFEKLGVKIHSKNEPERGKGSFIKMTLNAMDRSYIKTDPWKINKITKTYIEAIHQKTNLILKIPKINTRLTFRLVTYITKMDVTNLVEYVIQSNFDNFQQFANEVGLSSIRWDLWQNYLDSRTSNLFLVERIDITAPGYSIFSFFSEEPRAWSRVSASISNLNIQDAKILCLWFNSSFGILEYLFQRDEDRGGWMQLQKYIIKKLKVPNISKLYANDKENLVQTFNDLSSEQFPPILVQFVRSCPMNKITDEIMDLIKNQKTFPGLEDEIDIGFEPRRKIDSAVMKYIFHKNSKSYDNELNELYFNLLREILFLKNMMT